MFERLRLSSAAKRLLEEKLYETVVQELESGFRRDGLWGKAIANSSGSEEKAKALYIQYRVQSIKDEREVFNSIAEEVARQQKLDEESESEDMLHKAQQKSEKQHRTGHHHWSDDYRTHDAIVMVCSKCGDIHHGEGFTKCEGCGEYF